MSALAVWVTVLAVAALFVVAYFLLRRSRTAPEPKPETLAERVQRETLRQERLAVEREIESYFFAEDGAHDVLPEVDDLWREVAYADLERTWALPARERAK